MDGSAANRNSVGVFQSPSDRGGPFKGDARQLRLPHGVVSVPFRSGRAFQARAIQPKTQNGCCFSPLQIGEGLSSGVDNVSYAPGTYGFSPLQIGEGLSSTPAAWQRRKLASCFSPLQIGEGLSSARLFADADRLNCFSPLQIGEGLSRKQKVSGKSRWCSFQSPSDRGGPFKGTAGSCGRAFRPLVSVPFRSGRAFQGRACWSASFTGLCFSPLQIGEGLSSWRKVEFTRGPARFSPLQIGEGLSRQVRHRRDGRHNPFQSPSDRGGPFKGIAGPIDDLQGFVSVPFRSGRAFQGHRWTY